MNTSALSHVPDQTEPTLLRFGAGSVFLHLGLIALLSLINPVHVPDEEPPVVKVTLIETSIPEQAQEEAQSGASPLMASRRPIEPIQPVSPPPPIPATPPSPPMTMAHIQPSVQAPNLPPPVERRVLQDRHATDLLTFKGYLKSVQRSPTHPITSPPGPSPLNVPALPTPGTTTLPSPPAIERSVPQIPLSHSNPTSLLTATPSITNGISISKVGLGKTSPPVYPRIARESGWEGTVFVRVVVQADGTPDSVQVRKSSGHLILDNAAIDAVKRWQFVPAKDGNIAIRSIVEIPINFDLRQRGAS